MFDRLTVCDRNSEKRKRKFKFYNFKKNLFL